MNKPKRHHYIPVMLSKQFANQDGQLYFFDKCFPDKGIRHSSPGNLFVESHLYAQIDKFQQKDVAVEEALAELEARVGPIIAKILNSARNEKLPKLSSTEKNAWDLYLYIQWKRVPEVRERIQAKTFPPGLTPQDLLSKLPLTDDEYEKLSNPSEVGRIQNNAWVESVLDPGRNVLPTLQKKGVGVVMIRNPKYGFVIGSNPVLKLTYPGRPNLSDPSVEMWLPLAPDVAASPCPYQTEKLIIGVDKHVRAINKGIFKQSRMIAGNTPQPIASLIGESERTSEDKV